MSSHPWQDPRLAKLVDRTPHALQSLNVAAGQAGAPYEGKRTAHYEPSKCACNLPVVGAAINAATEALPIGFLCASCGQILNADTLGKAYRRWPGDLDTAEMQIRAKVLEAEAEMKGLIATLPREQQEHLERFARRDPDGFDIEARKMIDRYLAAKEHDRDAAMKNPNTRRRMMRTREAIADRIDAQITAKGKAVALVDGEPIGTVDALEIVSRGEQNHEPNDQGNDSDDQERVGGQGLEQEAP